MRPPPSVGAGPMREKETKNSLANKNFNFPFSVNLWFSSEGEEEKDASQGKKLFAVEPFHTEQHEERPELRSIHNTHTWWMVGCCGGG